MKQEKGVFEEQYESFMNGNKINFRKWLKGLSKANLLRFAVFCAVQDLLDIYEIEKQFNM